MSYTCTIYCNTGFNSVNIPDRPLLLENCQKLNGIDALEILTNRTLTGVKVRASIDMLQDADYIRIGDFYYHVKGVAPISADVSFLSLTPDFFTSAGGIDNFSNNPASQYGTRTMVILGGTTQRVHISDDTFGLYTEDDPLCAPAYPLDFDCFEYSAVQSDPGDQSVPPQYHPVIESAYDLYDMATNATGETYTDPNSGEVVTVPQVPTSTEGTDYTIYLNDYSQGGTGETIKLNSTPYHNLRYANDITGRKAIARARALGVESGISAITMIPTRWGIPQQADATTGVFKKMLGNEETQLTNLLYQYATVKNQKLLYSLDTPICITTPAGESIQLSIPDIYQAGDTAPTLRIISDPRISGCLYFGFKTFRGDGTPRVFFTHCARGPQWRQIPLVYSEASGKEINSMRFHQQNLSDAIAYNSQKSLTRAQAQEQAWQRYIDFTQASGERIGEEVFTGFLTGGSKGAITGLALSSLSTWSSEQLLERSLTLLRNSTDRQLIAAQTDYALGRQKELLEFGLAQNVVPTEVMYPAAYDLAVDVCREGCLVTRYKYSARDITRIDRLLTMYGYKHTKALEATDFTNRQLFNYVQASVTIGGLPGWWCEGVNAQLSNGVRIWHTLPNRGAYNNNPVVI